MNATVRHVAKAHRRNTGWHRWVAVCTCGWQQNGGSREGAIALAAQHGAQR